MFTLDILLYLSSIGFFNFEIIERFLRSFRIFNLLWSILFFGLLILDFFWELSISINFDTQDLVVGVIEGDGLLLKIGVWKAGVTIWFAAVQYTCLGVNTFKTFGDGIA